jgi:DNA-binding protein HU-beta
MKSQNMFLLAGLLAVPLLALPVTLNVSQTANGGTSASLVVSIDENSAEARSRSRSSSSRSRSRSSSSRSRSRSRTPTKSKSGGGWFGSKKPKKTKAAAPSATKKGCAPKCSASGSGGKLDTKGLFKGGAKKTSAPKIGAKKTSAPKIGAKKTSAPKIGAKKTSAPKIGGKARPKINTASRAKATSKRTASLKSPQMKKTRLTSQRAGATKMRSRSRLQSRRMRANVGYYPGGSYGYNRNRYYAGYRSTWGYGYRPGYTYHRGWGLYGYGYTRGGIGIIDAMLLYSIFGHSNTSRGDTVVNNNTTYVINGAETDVTSVPEGSRLTGFGSKKKLIVPGKDGNEVIEIPAGSTFTKTDNGMLVTTPDGVAVLVPTSADAYKAEDGYKVPPEAAEAMVYEDLKK